ncbi:hypothetical protein RvY_04717 [Ramazzottius varieornatus]|uniref:Uncharacterized protein n=1 Tax=Ramazzottius varieornatus TaxID=947166 RepID=A0A1D1V2H8_RAMVA|nr:hypothetical protein RvY_04717 [Ramazzottius varieornatus]
MATLGRHCCKLPRPSQIISQCVRRKSWNQMGPSGDRHSPIITSKTATINQETYSERTGVKRQNVQAQEVAIASKPDAVTEFYQKKTAVKDAPSKGGNEVHKGPLDVGSLTKKTMPTFFSSPSSQHQSRPRSVQGGFPASAPLEHTSGWGAQWQLGGTGSGRNNFYYAPNYSQGAGETEMYVGNMRSNNAAFFPNNSRRLSNGKIEDHTKPWGDYQPDLDLKNIYECKLDLNIGVRKETIEPYETGKVDEWGNVRGQIQRPVPKNHVYGTDKNGRHLY